MSSSHEEKIAGKVEMAKTGGPCAAGIQVQVGWKDEGDTFVMCDRFQVFFL